MLERSSPTTGAHRLGCCVFLSGPICKIKLVIKTMGTLTTAALLLTLALHQAAAQIPNAEALNYASYQPVNVTCPSRSLLRNAGTAAANNQSINPDEASYIERRRQNEVASAFETYLANNITGYDLNALAPNASYCKATLHTAFMPKMGRSLPRSTWDIYTDPLPSHYYRAYRRNSSLWWWIQSRASRCRYLCCFGWKEPVRCPGWHWWRVATRLVHDWLEWWKLVR